MGGGGLRAGGPRLPRGRRRPASSGSKATPPPADSRRGWASRSSRRERKPWAACCSRRWGAFPGRGSASRCRGWNSTSSPPRRRGWSASRYGRAPCGPCRSTAPRSGREAPPRPWLLCMSVERILEALDRHEPAALARAITLVENQRDGFEQVLSHAHAALARGAGRRVGITGPPGAGKSTLTERLIQHYRAQGLSVGVVAGDPPRPVPGGGPPGGRLPVGMAGPPPPPFLPPAGTPGA